MKKINICVFSLWTSIPMFKIERGPLIIHSLAVAQASKFFGKVVFESDSGGIELAESMGWNFTEVKDTLETFNPEGLNHIWALGKLRVCGLQEEPFVHLDGDVVISKPLPNRVLNARICAQSQDIWEYYTGENMLKAFEISGLPSNFPKYNAGVLGGTDLDHFNEYVSIAVELANKFKWNELNGTATSMMIEQNWLGVYAERHGIPVGTVAASSEDDTGAKNAGYVHFHGDYKRNLEWVKKAEATLARDYPERYAVALKGLKEFNL